MGRISQKNSFLCHWILEWLAHCRPILGRGSGGLWIQWSVDPVSNTSRGGWRNCPKIRTALGSETSGNSASELSPVAGPIIASDVEVNGNVDSEKGEPMRMYEMPNHRNRSFRCRSRVERPCLERRRVERNKIQSLAVLGSLLLSSFGMFGAGPLWAQDDMTVKMSLKDFERLRASAEVDEPEEFEPDMESRRHTWICS